MGIVGTYLAYNVIFWLGCKANFISYVVVELVFDEKKDELKKVGGGYNCKMRNGHINLSHEDNL